MANNNFRSDRGRDPLAELARLIGQGDPSGGGSYGAARPRATAAREADWAPEDHYDTPAAPHGDTRYAAQPAPDQAYAPADYHAAQQAAPARYQDAGYQDSGSQERGYQEQAYQDQAYQDQAYQQDQGHSDHGLRDGAYRDQAYQDQGFDERAGSRFFSGPAGQFNGFREEPGQGLPAEYDDAPPQMPPAHDLPVFPFAPDDQRYQGDEQHYAEDEAAPAGHGYRNVRRSGPRTALVAIIAVLGLVVVGSAGAFGYRAMFGGSFLPTLPPIIKASNGPNKIAPDPQAGAAAGNAQTAATTGSTENLVSREEQPVAIEAPKTAAPRVVATIPIVSSGQNGVPPGISAAPAAIAPQNGPNRVASADPPGPAAQPAPPTALATVGPGAPPAPPVQVSSEPKKIHTVTIRGDQTGTVPDAATAAGAANAARPQSRAAAVPRAAAPPPAGGSAPMSIVPGQGGDAPPAPAPRVRAASTTPSAAPSPSPGGGSYIQVTSRKTEGEAQAEFRALQAKFPGQLNGREPVIRRADIPDKGTFYRALVGPFASPEDAAQFCSGLKAAGGNCILQRN